MKKKFGGVVVPAVTPLTSDLRIDGESLRRMFAYFASHHVHPFLLGTTGEAPSVAPQLKKEILELAGKIKRSGFQLYAGISANSYSESVELAKMAFDNGADVVVATLPSYYTLRSSAMLHYLEQLADAVAGPMMIYNIPATTHMTIPLEIIETISHHPNVVGLKDSERDEDRMMEALQRWSNRADFSYLLGWAARSANALQAGADGLVPSTGNVHPSLYTGLVAAIEQGDFETAGEAQQLSDVLGDLYQKNRTLGESLWALKVLMQSLNLCQAVVMPPLFAGGEDEAKELQHRLEQIISQSKFTINFNG